VSVRSEIFDKALHEITTPALTAEGFVFDGSRTFRRVHTDKQFSEIINFQLGQRSHEGTFTVNLGVFISAHFPNIDLHSAHEVQCAIRQRLGHVVPTKFQALSVIPFFGQFFGPADTWWPFSSVEQTTNKSVSIVTAHIVNNGIPWLTSCRP
jgi:Domain of unknown function (DUF4304)